MPMRARAGNAQMPTRWTIVIPAQRNLYFSRRAIALLDQYAVFPPRRQIMNSSLKASQDVCLTILGACCVHIALSKFLFFGLV